MEIIENSFKIVIGWDSYQDIASKEVVGFYSEIGVRDINSSFKFSWNREFGLCIHSRIKVYRLNSS